MKSHFMILSVWVFLCLLCSCGLQKQEEELKDPPKLPNVVFIFTDDLGYGDLSSYNPDSKIITPNIDRLVSEGMKFTDAHTSSAVCTPSRYSLLTGRYCWRTEHKRGVQGGYGLPLITPDRMTLGNLFQDQGYATAAIGKWHVGMEWTLKEGHHRSEQSEATVNHTAPLKLTPVDQGFDYYFGTSGCTSDDGPFAFIENRQLIGNALERIEGLNVVGDGDYIKDVWASEGWRHELADTIFTNRTIAFIRDQVDNDKPFFAYLALSLPHIPWLPADFVKGSTGAGPRGDQVALTDYCVGEIEKTLKELGIKDNTILVFSSDNGPREGINGHLSAGLLRGLKGQIFEGGHRVPLVVRWPAKVKAGSVSVETVCMTDFMATFANILGVELPINAGEDSYNFSSVLLGRDYQSPLRPATVHHSGAGAFAIRKGDWKIIYGELDHGESPDNPENWTKRGYLFNLREDPYETNNIYGQKPGLVAEMNQLLYDFGIL